jgi:hypothetical protein
VNLEADLPPDPTDVERLPFLAGGGELGQLGSLCGVVAQQAQPALGAG